MQIESAADVRTDEPDTERTRQSGEGCLLLSALVGSLCKAGRDDSDALDALLTAGFNGFLHKFFRNGTNGQIECSVSEEEINESGDWSYQLHFIFDGVGQWRTDIGHFRVFGNLEE